MSHDTPDMGKGKAVDREFCQRLPKVELHAHLTGSITPFILSKVYAAQCAADPTFRSRVEDPAVAMARPGVGQDIGSFFAHFNTYLYHLICNIPSLTLATQHVLEAFHADGVVYLELRTTPRALPSSSSSSSSGSTSGSTPASPTSEATIRAVLSVIERWNATAPTSGMLVNLILSIDRAKHSASQALEIVRLASSLRDSGQPVVGVDLCGDPSAPVDIPSFRPAFQLARSLHLGITLHFAEVASSSSPTELDELLSWAPHRLGHAIHVPPPHRAEIMRRGIHVELCLTCNVLAKMLPEGRTMYADHHFREWWEDGKGEGVSLGTDDVGVFGSWASDECGIAAREFGLGRRELVGLMRGAAEGCFGGERGREWVDRRLRDFEAEEEAEGVTDGEASRLR